MKSRNTELVKAASGYQTAVRKMLEWLIAVEDYSIKHTQEAKRVLMIQRVRQLVQEVNCGHFNSRYVLDPIVHLIDITAVKRLGTDYSIVEQMDALKREMRNEDDDACLRYVSKFVDLMIVYIDHNRKKQATTKGQEITA